MNNKELYKGLVESYYEVLSKAHEQLLTASGSTKLRLKYQIHFVEDMIKLLSKENIK